MRQSISHAFGFLGSQQFMRGYAVGRVYTIVLAVIVLLVGAGGMLLSATAQDAARPDDFSPFEEPVAQPGGTLPRYPPMERSRSQV
jgi:hypothetical protein